MWNLFEFFLWSKFVFLHFPPLRFEGIITEKADFSAIPLGFDVNRYWFLFSFLFMYKYISTPIKMLPTMAGMWLLANSLAVSSYTPSADSAWYVCITIYIHGQPTSMATIKVFQNENFDFSLSIIFNFKLIIRQI